MSVTFLTNKDKDDLQKQIDELKDANEIDYLPHISPDLVPGVYLLLADQELCFVTSIKDGVTTEVWSGFMAPTDIEVFVNECDDNELDKRYKIVHIGAGVYYPDIITTNKTELSCGSTWIYEWDKKYLPDGTTEITASFNKVDQTGCGSGESITVDPTYNPESENAQSGKAVAEAIEKNRGVTAFAPKLYEDISKYANPLTGLSVVSDVVIEAGSYIKKIKLFSKGVTEDSAKIFLLRASDNTCVYRKSVEGIPQGWNEFTIDFKTEEDCYLGLYNTMVMYTNSGVTDEYKFSNKVKSCSPLSPQLNSVVSISNLYSGNFALAVEWETSQGLQVDFDKKIDVNQGVENKGKILAVDNSGRVVCEDKNKIYSHGGIVSFIDDDCGQYVPEIWGDIISQTGIRMGFACVTDIMEKGTHTSDVYKPMQLTELQALYNDGHEVYSHSHTHPDFHSNSITLEDIDFQCRKSRDWLNAKGFVRNSNIIVYPGGMGNDAEKQAVVRQHYKYGIDTIEGGFVPEPITNPYYIFRYNADTHTLAELKSYIDTAIAQNKLIVFMNHAYELNKDKTNQIQKMVDLINYIKQQNGTILPFQEAIHRIYGW